MTRSLSILALLLTPLVAGGLSYVSPSAARAGPGSDPGEETRGQINGVIKHAETGAPIEFALVVLTCDCFTGSREAMTNARGIYSFGALPAGRYTVRAFAGTGGITKIIELPVGAKFRANFSLDPEPERVVQIVVKAPPVASTAAAAMTISMEEAKQLPVGVRSSRDFTAVVDLSPTASRDVSGITGAETYGEIQERGFTKAAHSSTFSIDVDTASYSNVRRFLRDAARPPADAVRVEELINYFSYDYPAPNTTGAPFSVTTEVADCPWNPKARLLHIGLQGREIPAGKLPPRNLVFLLDVSGSMSSADKLPLLQRAMKLMVSTLTRHDHVSIVVYAGASGVVLPPTSGADQAVIMAALDRLHAGGSTNGGAGIERAYALARERFDPKAINRVILATDGDFNVGDVSQAQLQALIEAERESGVFLSVLGLGTGNLKDQTMEMLADKGNGNYAYIDTIHEARKVLVEQAGATLVTIAKDVKIQVEFDPAQVKSYRLIGYENRALAAKDFDDDHKDAGEIGAGHSVTALYEFVPADPKPDARTKRQRKRDAAQAPQPMAELRLRFKAPDAKHSQLSSFAVVDAGTTLAASSNDFRFSAAVAEFGMLLRDSKHRGRASWAGVTSLAAGALGNDPGHYRHEFLDLVALAQALPKP
ncbi:YfbK domain-containing protein [Enhygromyxa salina]|uniref:YfbK domain-containing protein n=1 Tax=Enhygromyxa salina TaxID=215803 RepID=UPI0013FCFB9E|nr:von Willebrand factor type A domain-containing protein [Enhygromyxa salina]